MSPVYSVLLGLLAFPFAYAAVVTLYHVEQVVEGLVSAESAVSTLGLSAIGTGENGMTRYAMQYINSLAVNYRTDRTVTLWSEPITLNANWEEGATEYRLSNPTMSTVTLPSGQRVYFAAVDKKCWFDIPNQNGSCVVVQRLEGFPAAVTPTAIREFTTSYTGRLLPWATIEALPTATASGSLSSLAGAYGLLGTIIAGAIGALNSV
ncbi:unnamed protein product [Cyclocybe aegerita]|uniref:Uncharacterized protein n=1 Tax=Cyclocybe aegerita TaxID=1973307 RepID=A0A8S0Y184_CYCAE|nr:unnamed protein product [Cyclocybe aegerita]